MSNDPLAMPYLTEFIARRELRQLGYTDSIENLDCITADAFALIADQIQRIQKRLNSNGR